MRGTRARAALTPAARGGARRERPSVLVVGREGEASRALVTFLRARDFEVLWARDGESGHKALDAGAVDALVTELRAPRIDGLSLLRRARERDPGTCVVLVAERADVRAAVEGMRRGAADFQVRPLHHEKLLAVLEQGLGRRAEAARLAARRSRLDERRGAGRITGRSRAIEAVREQVRHVAPTRAPVLIEGEPGTGKGLVAEAVHRESPRHAGPFVRVRCAALDPAGIEDELFGRGAPARGSRASSRAEPRPGRLERAEGGTLLLDEVGALPAAVQVKLLRLLQDRSFERAGAGGTLRADVRLLAATRLDLAGEVAAGRFREDLAYRLGAVRVRVPPLRERPEDVPLLVERFVRAFDREHRRQVTGVTRGVLDRLVRHRWPGNVRELRDAVEDMVLAAEGRRPLELSDLPGALRELEGAGEPLDLRVGMTVDEAERRLIAATLRHCGNDKPRAAAMLGIGLRTLYRKLERG